MRTALALLAAALAAGGPTPTPAATPRRWILVRVDGARVELEAPPETRRGRLVGRLPGGTLVSIPAASVDEAATAKENSPESPSGAERKVRAVPTPRPFETPPLGDRARLRTSPDEARRLLEATRNGAPAPTPAGATHAVAPPVETEPRDLRGRGEEWWRERADRARSEMEEAARSRAEAEAVLEAAERAYLGPSEGERNSFAMRVNDARARLDRAREEERLAAARQEALQEEARKAGAFPGWLR